MVTRIEPLLTIADLDATPDDGNRYELIEGELFVSRAPSITHQRIIQNLQVVIVPYLARNPIGLLVAGAGIIFNNINGVIPDLVFVREERRLQIASGEKFTGAPDLVIEVMSPGKENRQRDLVIKRQLYGRLGVEEYWIVDPENRAVEVYRLREQSLEKIATLMDQDEITSPLVPGLQIKVQEVFEL
jgi:Uma2 family endonuclease